MAWILLVFAGLFGIAWVVGLKYAAGLTRFWPTVATILLSFVSFGLLARAAKDLPIGTSYAVWTGIGALGAAVLGILLFGESSSPLRLSFIALIIVGVIGLKLTARVARPEDHTVSSISGSRLIMPWYSAGGKSRAMHISRVRRGNQCSRLPRSIAQAICSAAYSALTTLPSVARSSSVSNAVST